MKVSEVQHLKNKNGAIRMENLTIEVTILDIREVYGNIRYLISPLAGTGSTWVDSKRVTLQEPLQNPGQKSGEI